MGTEIQDCLNRKQYIENIKNIIENISKRKDSVSFAIDGNWGCGKTFLLDLLKNELVDIQSEETASDKYLILNYNCWKYDYYEEPLVALAACLLDNLSEENSIFGKKIDNFFKALGKTATEVLGDLAEEISNILIINPIKVFRLFKKNKKKIENNGKKFDNLSNLKKAVSKTQKLLKTISDSKTIILLVDELDRCLPNYAIKVLERLHHITENSKNMVTIYSVDKGQLENTVSQIFGDKINTTDYLKKFIGFSIKLDLGEMNEGICSKFQKYISNFSCDTNSQTVSQQGIAEFLSAISSDLEIRTFEKLMQKAETLHNLVFGDEEIPIGIMFFEVFWVIMDSVYIKKGDRHTGSVNLMEKGFLFRNENGKRIDPFGTLSPSILKIIPDTVLNYFWNFISKSTIYEYRYEKLANNIVSLSLIGSTNSDLFLYLWCSMYKEQKVRFHVSNNPEGKAWEEYLKKIFEFDKLMDVVE